MDDGGQAFPVQESEYNHYCPGMSLRDWFAAHGNQPGVNEAYQLAGCPAHVKPPEDPWNPEDKRIDTMTWWTALPLAEKYRLYSELRYMLADAMLAARKVQP